MLSHSTIDTILNLINADRGATVVEIEATKKFLAGGCVASGPARVVVDGGLMLTKSAAARFLGVSRKNFGIEAEKIVTIDGKSRPQFTEHFIANEKFARYSKIELLEFLSAPRSAPDAAAAADTPAFQVAC